MADNDRSTQPSPIQLPSRRAASLVMTALRHRASDLEKLADKTSGEGYERESRTQRQDAAAIKELIMPAFQDQVEMPLVTVQELRAGIANALRDIVHKQLLVRAPEERQEDALRSREDELLDSLAIRIESFARELSAESYRAGFEARQSEPEAIAHRLLEHLQSAWT
jgi:predicted nucleic acid-binding protein